MSIRILGVELPVKKRLVIGLRAVYGIGPTRAAAVCKGVSISEDVRIKELDPDQVSTIADYIKQNYRVEGDLRREISGHIERLKTIRCYRGIRLRSRLPVRGQRTKSNSRTAKGKAGSTSIKKRKK